MNEYMIIGAMRSGTTTLHNCICSHPQIKKTKRKELNYYCLYYHKGFEWYTKQFPECAISGDASPFYLAYPQAAQRIYNDFPETKLIVILRNPVDRAWSHYQYVKRRWDDLSFEEAIAWETVRLEQYKPESYEYMVYSYLRMSRYSELLKPYFNLFNNILVLQSEEYYRNPQSTLDTVFEYLELPKIEIGLQYRGRAEYEQMSSYTRDYLQGYFEPYNQELFRMIGKDFEWTL